MSYIPGRRDSHTSSSSCFSGEQDQSIPILMCVLAACSNCIYVLKAYLIHIIAYPLCFFLSFICTCTGTVFFLSIFLPAKSSLLFSDQDPWRTFFSVIIKTLCHAMPVLCLVRCRSIFALPCVWSMPLQKPVRMIHRPFCLPCAFVLFSPPASSSSSLPASVLLSLAAMLYPSPFSLLSFILFHTLSCSGAF